MCVRACAHACACAAAAFDMRVRLLQMCRRPIAVATSVESVPIDRARKRTHTCNGNALPTAMPPRYAYAEEWYYSKMSVGEDQEYKYSNVRIIDSSAIAPGFESR